MVAAKSAWNYACKGNQIIEEIQIEKWWTHLLVFQGHMTRNKIVIHTDTSYANLSEGGI